jgi:hypothetical protein
VLGENWYRSLTYYFHLEWNSDLMGGYAQKVLSTFSVPRDLREERIPPTPGLPPSYALVDLGPESTDQFRYQLHYHGQRIAASEEPEYPLSHLLWHTNLETGRQTGSFLIVHAGGVRSEAGYGILFPAQPGAGKSTLVTALVREGFGYLSDELGVIDPVTGFLYPYPRAITLKNSLIFDRYQDLAPSRPPLTPSQWHLRPDDIRPAAVAGPCPPRLVVYPEYRQGAATELTRLSPGAGALALAQNAVNLPLYGARALKIFAKLAADAEFYRLISGDLEEAIDVVIELSEEAGSTGGVSDQLENTARSLEARSP